MQNIVYIKIILFNSLMYICNKCFIVFTRKDKYIQHISEMKLCNMNKMREPKKIKNLVENYIEESTVYRGICRIFTGKRLQM